MTECSSICVMPEGPEARTVADKMQGLIGWRLSEYKLMVQPKADNSNEPLIPGKQSQELKVANITHVWSYGKKVIITIDSDLHLVFELGMSGRFTYTEESGTKIVFQLSNDQEVKYLCWGYTRPHGAALHIFNSPQLQDWLSQYGPDLLGDYVRGHPISPEKWRDIWRTKKYQKWNLCKVLHDQHAIAGVGNYLKSEILYYAGLAPGREVQSLSDPELERLRRVTLHIMYVSYSYGGYTLESFISPDGAWGKYPAAIYGPINSKVTKDKYGNEIVRTKEFSGQTTSWCPAVQK